MAHIPATRFKISASFFSLIIAASFPSAICYLFVPFFWNSTDSFVYFIQQIQFAIPQYPPLYNGICRLLMHVTDGRPYAVYVLVLLQHVIYVAGLVYLAHIFKNHKARLLFTIAMALNITMMTVVNGVTPEGLFAGFELFFWGAFLRFLFGGKLNTYHTFIWAVSLVLLSLTKHIGQLWYIIPASAALYFLVRGWIKKRPLLYRRGFDIAALSIVSFILMAGIQNSMLSFFQVPNHITIGRQGIYRINELPWNTLDAVEKNALIDHYTKSYHDSLVRITFESVPVTKPWRNTYIFIDSILKAQHISNKTADDYLNAAFCAYITNIEAYGIKASLHDYNMCLSQKNISIGIINSTYSLCNNMHAAEEPEKWKFFFSAENCSFIHSICSGRLYNLLTGLSINVIGLICFIGFILCVVKLRSAETVLLLIPVIFAYVSLLINCFITVFLTRYSVAGYMEVYMALAFLIAVFFAKGNSFSAIFITNDSEAA